MAEEKRFENRIKDYLKERGHWYVKFMGNGYTRAGVPDLLICCNGHFVGIEVKAVRGHPSELQLREIRLIQEAGGTAMVLYPKDFDEFKELIKKLEEDKYGE